MCSTGSGAYRVNDLRDSAHRHRPAWVSRHAAAAGKPICLSRSLSRYDSSTRVPCGTSSAMGRRAGWIGSESGGRTVQPRKARLTTNLSFGPPDGRTRWRTPCVIRQPSSSAHLDVRDRDESLTRPRDFDISPTFVHTSSVVGYPRESCILLPLRWCRGKYQVRKEINLLGSRLPNFW